VFLVTILSTSLTVVLLRSNWIKLLAGGSIAVGMVMLAVAVAMAIWENQSIRGSLTSELEDMPHLLHEEGTS
jgi:K+ transporter